MVDLTDRELADEAIRRDAYQKPAELEPLIALVRQRRPRTVVEIGTFKGGTLFALCQVADPEALIVSMDLPKGKGLFGGGYSWREGRRFRKFARPGQTLNTLRRDSQDAETVREVEQLLGDRPIEFLMIDGDHRYEGVKRDWEIWEPLVAPGGLIAFHDILEHPEQPLSQVDRFWAEIAPGQRTVEFTDPAENWGHGQWGGIGVVFKDGAPAP
jgi:predicted O-methyltransferase YrrM